MDYSTLTIEEYTTPAPVVVMPEYSVEEAFMLMERANIRHLPVEDAGKIIGIVSDRDLRPFLGKQWSPSILVKDVMQGGVLSVPETLPIGDAAFLMAKNKIGSLLVVDDNGELSGIFTTTDALNALVEIALPEAHSMLNEYEKGARD